MSPPIKPVPDDEWEGVVAPTAGAQEDEWEGVAPGAAVAQDEWEGSNDPRSMRAVTESTGTKMQVPVEGPATAKSIVQGEQINRAQNEAAIDELLKRPNLGPAQRERLERLKAKFHDPFWYNQKNTERTVRDNLARGFAVGVVNNNILALADLALAAPDWLGIGLAEQLRDRIEEAQYSTKLIADPQGKEATLGNVVGTLIPVAAGKANPWAVANERGFKALQVLARKSPGAARALETIAKGFEPGATFNQRFVAQLVGSGAVDALQVADIFMNPRYGDDTSRMKALLLTIGAATAGAAFASIRPNKVAVAAAGQTPPGSVDPARAAQVASMAKQEADVVATKAAEKEFKAKVRSAWESANPGKSWAKDLTPSGRNKEMTQARVKQQPNFIKTASTDKLKKIATQLEKSIVEAKDEAAATDARQTLKVVQDEIASRSTDSNVNPSAATPSTIDLRGMGKGISENLYAGMFDAHQKGSTKFAGVDDPVLVAAKNAGVKFNSVEELKDWVNNVYSVRATNQPPPPEPSTSPPPSPAAQATEATPPAGSRAEGAPTPDEGRVVGHIAPDEPETPIGPAIRTTEESQNILRQVLTEFNAKVLAGQEPTKEELEIAVEHLGRTVDERNAALRAAEIDPGTGFGNSLAWEKAKPAIDADPDIDVVYVDVKNLHAANAVRTHEGMNKYFEEIGEAVRKAEKEVGSVKDGSRAFRVGGDEFVIAVPASKSEAFKKALAKALPDQPIYNKGKWKKYVTGVTIASGKTTADADRALTVQKVKTLKPSEDDVRAMTEDRAKPIKTKKPKGEGEILVAGIKLTKPLADHTAKDLDKNGGLLDRLDKALEEQQITPAQYGSALEKIGQHRRTLPAANEQFTVEQIAAAKADAAKKRLVPEEDPPIPSGPTVSMAVVNVKNANGQINQYRALSVADAERQAIKAGDLPPDYHTLNTPQREKLAEITYESVPIAKVAPVEGVNTIKVKAKPVAAEPSGIDIRKTPVTQLTDDLLQKVIDKLRVDNASIHSRERAGHPMIKRFEDAVAELARRRNGGSSNGSGVVVHTNPAVTGFVAGFAGGFLIPADSDQQRLENALYAGAAVAAGTWYVNKRFQQAKTDGTPSYQRTIRAKVKSIEDQPFTERIGLSNYLHNAWMGIARRSHPAEKLTEAVGRVSSTFMHNLGRQAEMFGLYRGRTDYWVKGDGPAYFNELGNPQAFVDENGVPIPSLQNIAAMNDGDTRTIGDLAAAARELEVRATRGKTLGIDYDAAREMFTRATPRMHEARAALTKYFRALADLQVMDGLISPEVRQKFNSDEMYVAIRRLFNEQTGKQAGQLDVKKHQTGAAVPQTSFKMTGSKRDIQNPFEAAIDMTGRVQRAAELNRMAKTFVAYLDALPPEVRQHVGQRLSKAPDIAGLDEAAKALKADLADANISIDDAKNILMGLSDESLNVTNGVLRYYDQGVPQAVRLAEPYERMFRSFRPQEMQFVMAGLAPVEKLTNLAKIGITANPIFVAYQAIRDVWQYYMNGAYGGIPGISLLRSAGGSIAGAFHIITKSPEYRKFIAAGGVGDSIASQGLQITRDGLSLLRQVQTAPARTKIGEVINDAKTLNWTGLKDAYANAIISISDAGRVGAYLAERGRGASVLDALYATKKYGANFSNRGDWAVVQALNKLTLFLNPSIQGLSASVDAFKQNPINWFARGMAGIAIPSMLLYFAYEDDEQIRELRGTPTGRKFWWMRGPDNGLIKIPKPLFEGELFGSSVEAVLDNYREGDPVAFDTWREAMLNDVTLNLTPLIASLPLSLWANKDLNFGGQITPDRNVDPAYLRNQNTTGLSQEVAGLMSNWTDDIDNPGVRRALSPAGIDYIVRNLGGTLSYEAMKAVSVVMKYSRTGEMPLRDELPFVNSAFPAYPSGNVQSIKEFYMMADRADRAKQSVQYLIDNRLGEDASKYVVDHLEDVALAPLYADARAELTDLRKAIQDIRQLPPEWVPKGQTKQQMIQEIQDKMILIARQTNLAARSARAQITAQQTAKDTTSPSDSTMNH